MKSLTKMLPALGLVLGATLAMAMNFASPSNFDASLKVWTPDEEEPFGYLDITGLQVGTHFRCEGTSSECRVQFTDDDPENGIKTVMQAGVYTPL
ncbi:DUF6520 family protein [Algoriphagus sp.]|uniref:DUF6520 family protein n=1 Tax=Algoriphagus sp. TaxID=1872435 RepID=UPI003F70F17C